MRVFRFCVTLSCFLSHFVSRDHFRSEVSCVSSMASASWALLLGGEACSILIYDISLTCDGPVWHEAAMVYPFFVLVPDFSVRSHKFRQFLWFVAPALLLDFLVTVFLAVLVVSGPMRATCPS